MNSPATGPTKEPECHPGRNLHKINQPGDEPLRSTSIKLSLASKRDLSAANTNAHCKNEETRTFYTSASAIHHCDNDNRLDSEPIKNTQELSARDCSNNSATTKTRFGVKTNRTMDTSSNLRLNRISLIGAMCTHKTIRIQRLISVAALLALFLSTSLVAVHGQPPPPPAGFLDFDNLPVTRFSCEGKVIGGYYADVETGCQMFHVCTLGQKDEVQDIKFLCLNGTVFDQETRVCERVDEVDCSQAEKFYDLNLDLYVPHATTTSTTPPPTTTTTTTTARTTPRPIPVTSPKSASHFGRPFANSFNTHSNGFNVGTGTGAAAATAPERERERNSANPAADNDNNGKGFSTYAYFHRTPHSVISSGYNSQLRQSYLINHQQANNNAPSSSTAPIIVETRTSQQSSSSASHGHGHNPTGRKVAAAGGSANKPIIYTSTRPSVISRQQQVVSSTTPKQQQYHHQSQSSSTVKSVQPIVDPNTSSLQIEYPEDDEYYDEAEDYAQLVAGGGGGVGTGPSAPDAATILQANHHLSTKIELSDHVNRVSKNISPATALNFNAKQQQTPKPSPISILQQHHHIIHDNSTEEPYYYDEEYEDPVPVHVQPQRHNQQHQQQQTHTGTSRIGPAPAPAPGPPSSSSSGSGETDSPEYYDENDESTVDVNSHHFSHVDVPRIPYAKPNVPRVLVTNGKPFLPRLRRQSFYTHHLDPGSSLWNYYLSTVNTFNQNSNSDKDSNLNHFGSRSR